MSKFCFTFDYSQLEVRDVSLLVRIITLNSLAVNKL